QFLICLRLLHSANKIEASILKSEFLFLKYGANSATAALCTSTGDAPASTKPRAGDCRGLIKNRVLVPIGYSLFQGRPTDKLLSGRKAKLSGPAGAAVLGDLARRRWLSDVMRMLPPGQATFSAIPRYYPAKNVPR